MPNPQKHGTSKKMQAQICINNIIKLGRKIIVIKIEHTYWAHAANTRCTTRIMRYYYITMASYSP